MPVQLEYGRSESKSRIARRTAAAILAAVLCFAIVGPAWLVAIKTLQRPFEMIPVNVFLNALHEGKVSGVELQGNDVWGEFTQPQPTIWGSRTTLKFGASFPGPLPTAQVYIQSHGGYPNGTYGHPLMTLELWVVSRRWTVANILVGDALLSLALGIWLFARWQRRAASRLAG